VALAVRAAFEELRRQLGAVFQQLRSLFSAQGQHTPVSTSALIRWSSLWVTRNVSGIWGRRRFARR
jgi:hypothetical protein